ncbi:hypothetical protein RP20_CCG016799 [Aedes albopictus]|nr:hypothetical protein RP20_CCG016799 [Aedes albopictus]
MNKHPMFFETTYAADYSDPVTNRKLCLQNESDSNGPESCFSPPFSCTTPVSAPEPTPAPEPPTECGTNRFVPNLCHSHPEVYADLQANRPWCQQSGQSPLKTTYNIDYDHLSEYQLGPYPEDTKYYIRECNGTACNGQSCCAGGLCSCQLCPSGGVNGCKGQYPDHSIQKPSKIPKGYISFSHWPERPYQDEGMMTEYRAKVGHVGSVIEREQIHDHQNCKMPSTCRHAFIMK